MCLTTEAFVLFLNILSPQVVDLGDTSVTIRAEIRDAVWEYRDESGQWCTDAPKIDAMLRLETGEAT